MLKPLALQVGGGPAGFQSLSGRVSNLNLKTRNLNEQRNTGMEEQTLQSWPFFQLEYVSIASGIPGGACPDSGRKVRQAPEEVLTLVWRSLRYDVCR